MRRCIHACCIAATLALPARAQDAGNPPAPAEAMAAYRAVDGWVRAWNVGKVEVFRPEDPQVPLCQAASVTLRLAGETIARGVEVAADAEARKSIVAAATRAALKEAEPKLNIPRDAMYEATRKDVAARITISLQLAGDLTPISPKDAAEAAAIVAPGLEGVGARLGDRIAVTFPERLLTTQTEPGPALGTLVGKLAGDATLAVEPLSKLAKDHAAVFYKFRVTHLVQHIPGDTPGFVSRGGRVVRLREMGEGELRRWADALAVNLAGRCWKGAGQYGLAGTINPLQGAHEATFATPLEQAVVCIALRRHIEMGGAHQRPEILEAYRHLVQHLATVEPDETPPWSDALTAAAWLQALEFGPGPNRPAPTDEALEAMLLQLENRVDGAFDGAKFDPSIPEAGRGLIVWRLTEEARLSYVTPPPGKEPGVVEARRIVLRDIRPGAMVALMPWLGWAESCWTESEAHRKREVTSAVALREMRAQLWAHQIQPDDLPDGQQDLAGGIVFDATRQPMPTWQVAKPLAFVATMLGDSRLTEDKEVSEEISRLLRSLRFLRQLTAGGAEAFMYPNPDRALNGVRSSLWDQRMPPEATAMTLLTVCETLRSLDEIRKRQEQAK